MLWISPKTFAPTRGVLGVTLTWCQPGSFPRGTIAEDDRLKHHADAWLLIAFPPSVPISQQVSCNCANAGLESAFLPIFFGDFLKKRRFPLFFSLLTTL
jgi:hypothetical protein